MQAIDQIVNSAGKTYYMSGGNVPCPVVFRGPNGAAAGVAAQHSQDVFGGDTLAEATVVTQFPQEDCETVCFEPWVEKVAEKLGMMQIFFDRDVGE